MAVAEYLEHLAKKYSDDIDWSDSRHSSEVFRWDYSATHFHLEETVWDLLLAEFWCAMVNSRRRIQTILSDGLYLYYDYIPKLPDYIISGLLDDPEGDYSDILDLTMEDLCKLESLQGDEQEVWKFSEYLRLVRLSEFTGYLKKHGIKKIYIPVGNRSLRNTIDFSRILTSFCDVGWKIDGVLYRLNTKISKIPTFSKKEETIYCLILE
jgi:hypothetical protein